MNHDIKIIRALAIICAGVGVALIIFSIILNAFIVFNTVAMVIGILTGLVICAGSMAIEAFTFNLERRRKLGRRKNI